MKKLLVNATAMDRTSAGGRRYAQGILNHLDWPSPIERVIEPRGPSGLIRLREFRYINPRDSVLWSPAHRGPLFAHHHVVTVLDCISLDYVYVNDWRVKAYKLLLSTMLHHADVIVTISQSTRQALLTHFPSLESRTVAIAGPTRLEGHFFEAVEHMSHPMTEQAPFLMAFTNRLPHKNTARLIRGYLTSRAHRQGIKLHLIGTLDATSQELVNLNASSFVHDISVTDLTLDRLFRSSLGLLSPSLSEGLNFPIAEALARHVRVACSDIAVHREFYDGAVTWFDPMEAESIAAAVDALAFDSSMAGVHRALPASAKSFAEVAMNYRSIFAMVSNR